MERAVQATVAYFSLFRYPLTAQEVWRNLFAYRASFAQVCATLDILVERGELRFVRGVYILPGDEEMVELRRRRYVITEFKMRTCRSATRILAALPFVRMVGVVNSLSWSNAHEKSDCDLCIVVERGYIALARLLCTGLMQLAGFRTHRRDPICLTFFVSDAALDLSSLQIAEEGGIPDVYLAYWIAQFTPIFDEGGWRGVGEEGGWYDRLYRANAWIEAYVPQRLPRRTSRLRRVTLAWPLRAAKRLAETALRACGPSLERLAFAFQMRILPRYLSELANTDSRVVMSESYMKFHANDRRTEYRDAFVRICREKGIWDR